MELTAMDSSSQQSNEGGDRVVRITRRTMVASGLTAAGLVTVVLPSALAAASDVAPADSTDPTSPDSTDPMPPDPTYGPPPCDTLMSPAGQPTLATPEGYSIPGSTYATALADIDFGSIAPVNMTFELYYHPSNAYPATMSPGSSGYSELVKTTVNDLSNISLPDYGSYQLVQTATNECNSVSVASDPIFWAD